MPIEFELTEDFIELTELLKATRLADTGGMAKAMIENGEVKRNGNPEAGKNP